MKVLTKAQMTEAAKVLETFLPQSQQVYGHLLQMSRIRSFPLDIAVDTWPNFAAIICKPRVETEGDLFKDSSVFTKDGASLRKILAEPAIVNWGKFFCLADLSLEAVLKEEAERRGVSWKRVTTCYMLKLQCVSHLPTVDRYSSTTMGASMPEPGCMFQHRLPTHLYATSFHGCLGMAFKADAIFWLFPSALGLRISSLDESHVDLVNRSWKFGAGKHSVSMIQGMIRHFPSCCLQDGEGRAVAWILTYPSGCMGMLYTVPEHRGKGYAKIVINAMSQRLHSEGYPAYCFIEEENKLSFRLFKGLGFTEDPTYRVAWFTFNHL
ncbi:glycine N-acyltransferase-like protein 3 isoform X2 [Brienomyrus brachyistius]|uniref:glycine N-acyltransferase-like protein 3 isoform X2 n=1 Tax=Brienomyrus brachyistius TaxID=42636 RepID=UPI0020B23375|nr:glycine N-acyltransferase-like protein 3 isoform X2 [Brienomyrus brachyistius]